MNPPDQHEAIRLLRTMTRTLCAVGALALVFTTVNVTLFARSRGVPLPIAILLDPMLGAALAVVLYADARLASWGIRPPGWSTALRWSAGSAAALMNSWESLWPDGQIGWPRRADPAAVLLHLTPALLLILLTETIAAYRRIIANLPNPTGTTAAPYPEPNTPPPPPIAEPTLPHALPPHADTESTTVTDNNAADTPVPPPPAPPPHPGTDDATDADLWARAAALDTAARTTTGRPASVWRLRTELHIGPDRAAQIHAHLATRQPANPPPPA
ncbi:MULTISPECIES: extensin [unclassified Streptomyces]|uniref:extensin n=2 Tax=Streptomyces TaxID=1883 RepID=UPI002E176195|nr:MULTISPECIES: extensin [unclassified Streptomyces]